ncbi:MAG: hypothetical protein ACTSRC_22420, partial [Candidatus Helarchaeota archaeon]
EKRVVSGVTLFRIKALTSFGNVKKGDLGGWIEKEDNLSQDGNAWVFDDACVFDDARVFDNAYISNNAWIFNKAWVFNNAQVFDNAKVFGNGWVSDNGRVFGNAQICNNAQIRDNANVSDNARVFHNAAVYGNAQVFDDAWVFGNAQVFGNTWVYERHHVYTGFIGFKLSNIESSLRGQLGLCFINNKIVLYKRVNKIGDGKYSSCYDENFIYQDGKISEVKDADMSNASSSTGIHCSLVTYWEEGDTTIAVEIKKEDVITVQEGKVRCRKVKVIGEV